MKKEFTFSYEHYDSCESLPARDRELIGQAREAYGNSHAPYSGFRVGAAALLESGKIIRGSNQESEVFPAGMCAERTLLFAHMAADPGDRIIAMAIASDPGDKECYPCGMCRQVLSDVEKRQQSPIRLIMSSASGATAVESTAYLMPFTFEL